MDQALWPCTNINTHSLTHLPVHTEVMSKPEAFAQASVESQRDLWGKNELFMSKWEPLFNAVAWGLFLLLFFWSVCFCSLRIKWNLIRRSSVYNCQNDLQLKQCSAYMGEPRRLLIWMCNEKHPISCVYQLFNRPEVNTLILLVCDGFRLFFTSDLYSLSFMQLQPSSHLVFLHRI